MKSGCIDRTETVPALASPRAISSSRPSPYQSITCVSDLTETHSHFAGMDGQSFGNVRPLLEHRSWLVLTKVWRRHRCASGGWEQVGLGRAPC